MTDFTPYDPVVPDKVSHISFNIRSEMVEDVDQHGDPLGTFTETEFIDGFAIVQDQNGEVVKIHNAGSYTELIEKNVMTAQQLQTIQTFLQNVRDTIEGILLP
jgi:vacuolar-type H+-ATPase catalytic subunit A/Vma1